MSSQSVSRSNGRQHTSPTYWSALRLGGLLALSSSYSGSWQRSSNKRENSAGVMTSSLSTAYDSSSEAEIDLGVALLDVWLAFVCGVAGLPSAAASSGSSVSAGRPSFLRRGVLAVLGVGGASGVIVLVSAGVGVVVAGGSELVVVV